jgi:DNA-directed RNA polymerase specialized sigma24 family protein
MDIANSVVAQESLLSNEDWGALLLRRHDGAIRRRVRRTLRGIGLRVGSELVEEIVQEIYCRLFDDGAARLRNCHGGSNAALASYLGTIAEHAVVDHVRCATALKRGGLDMVRRSRRQIERIADPGHDPEYLAVCRDHRREFLDRCRTLRGLGSGRRNAWVMRLALLEGYSSHEIARAAGGRLTPRGIDLLVHRIRRRLARDGFALRHR